MSVHTTYFAALQHDLDLLEGGPGEDAFVVAVTSENWRTGGDQPVDRNVPALAPPDELQHAYRAVKQAGEDDPAVDDPDEVAWRTVNFERRYREHLDRGQIKKILSKLRRRERDDGELWLVCYEKDPAYCHRRVLADVLLRGRDQDPVHHPEPDSSDVDDRLPDAQLDDYDRVQEAQ